MKKHLLFETVDDLLRFLGEQRSGGKASWKKVRIGSDSYVIELPQHVELTGFRFGGVEIADEAHVLASAPLEVEVSELLRAIGLRADPAASRRHKPSYLVLAVSTDDPKPASIAKARADARKRLYETWRRIGRSDATESWFYFGGPADKADKGDGAGIDAIIVTELSESWDWQEFLAKAKDDGVKVLLPAEEGYHRLFVEAGYVYPRPQLFRLLHDTQQGGVMLCFAGSERRVKDLAGLWHEPSWSWLSQNLVIAGDVAVFREDGDRTIRRLELPADAEVPEIVIEVGIGGVDQSIGSHFELESRIAACQAEMERLQSLRGRLAERTFEDFLPVYLWFQREGEQLSSGLRAFLRRPFGDLAHFRYLCHPAPTGGGQSLMHLVIGDQAMPGGDALAVNADHVFLQHSRWEDSGLPVFVRADCALTEDLSEEGLAQLFREQVIQDLLDREGIEAGSNELMLIGPPGGLLAPPEVGALHLTVLSGLDSALSLSPEEGEAVRWLNTWAGSPATIERVHQADMAMQTERQSIQLESRIVQLDEAMLKRAEALNREVFGEWEAFRARARTVLSEAQLGNVLMNAISRHYAALPETWKEFFKGVLSANEAITKDKVEAMRRWEAEIPKTEEAMAAIEAIEVQAAKFLERLEAPVEERRSKLEREITEMERGLDALRREREQLLPREAELEQRVQILKRESDELDERLKEAVTLITRHEAGLAEIRSRHEELRAANQRARQLQQNTEAEAAALEAVRRQGEELSGAIATEQQRLAMERGALGTALGTLEERVLAAGHFLVGHDVDIASRMERLRWKRLRWSWLRRFKHFLDRH